MIALSAATMFAACGDASKKSETSNKDTAAFNVLGESFADLQLLRYQVPGWDELSLQQKTLAYYLYEAALCGRDLYYDQADKHGLALRKTI